MELTIYDKFGDATAYLCDDYHNTIYLWDGRPAAYLYEEQHLYGINGRHLGWFVDGLIFTNSGDRIGFNPGNCPVNVTKEPSKIERRAMDEIRPRWQAPPFPKLTFNVADQPLLELLQEGMVQPFKPESSVE